MYTLFSQIDMPHCIILSHRVVGLSCLNTLPNITTSEMNLISISHKILRNISWRLDASNYLGPSIDDVLIVISHEIDMSAIIQIGYIHQ